MAEEPDSGSTEDEEPPDAEDEAREPSADADAKPSGDDEYGGSRSELDAMGNDKRREVVGKQYGATLRKRLLIYGAFVGVVVIVAIAFLTVVRNYDNRDMPIKQTAPWAKADESSQKPVRDVDFPQNGQDDRMPANQIVNR